MDSKELSIITDNIVSIAHGAGDVIMKIYDSPGFETSIKSDNSPLTEADTQANEYIISELKKHYPDYAILSEESADDRSRLENDYCFLVDPLDGTKEFIKRNGEFTVNIALVYKGKPVAGAVYLPAADRLYYASENNGAYLIHEGKTKKIQVSDRTENPRLVVSRSHRTADEDRLIEELGITEVKEAGSSLKGCMVAEGEAEMYYRFGPTMEWDTAAMHVVVEEAGGIINQIDHSPLVYNKPEPKNAAGFYVRNIKG